MFIFLLKYISSVTSQSILFYIVVTIVHHIIQLSLLLIRTKSQCICPALDNTDQPFLQSLSGTDWEVKMTLEQANLSSPYSSISQHHGNNTGHWQKFSRSWHWSSLLLRNLRLEALEAVLLELGPAFLGYQWPSRAATPQKLKHCNLPEDFFSSVGKVIKAD